MTYTHIVEFSKYIIKHWTCDRCGESMIWNKLGWFDAVDPLSKGIDKPFTLIILCSSCEKQLMNQGYGMIKAVSDALACR